MTASRPPRKQDGIAKTRLLVRIAIVMGGSASIALVVPAVAHAQSALEVARSALPADFPVTSTITDGPTVEAAINKLDWYDGDLIMVGSSRLAQPRRLFLGSTAAKMLHVVQVPMVVVPKEDAAEAI